MVSTTLPTVSSSFRAGSTTEMVRPAFAACSSATVHEGRFQLWSVNHLPVTTSVAGSSGVNVMLRLPLAPVLARPSLRSSLAFVSMSCQSPYRAHRRTHALDRRDHFQHVSCGPHLVNAEHGGSVRGGQGRRGEGALQALCQTHTQSFPDEILVAECHQDRPSSFYKVFYMAQQTKTVISVLAEIVGRVDEHGILGHPDGHRTFGGGGHLGDHVVDDAAFGDAVVDPERPRTGRRTACVRAHQPRPELGGD